MPSHRHRLTAEKIAQRLALIAPLVHRRSVELPPFRLRELADASEDPPLSEPWHDWPEIPHESYWGRPDLNFLMRTEFTVPADWPGQRLALFLPLGEAGDIFTHPEGLVYVDGKPLASADRYHHTVPLPDSLADGRHHEVALHGWTGLSGWPPDPTSRAKLFMGRCRLVERDRATQSFLIRARAALDSARQLDEMRPERHGILTSLDAAFRALDTRDPLGEDFYASVPEAMEVLDTGLARAGSPLDVRLHAIGHAHMDVAYLWPVSQIRRKTARTFSNALRLMQDHRDFLFSCTQPQLYRFTEDDYPDIFYRIQAAVARGQWEVLGGMWVEPDVNIPGPESLVRQLVLGRRYYADRFGPDAETPALFLPDTFGFPWSLPQLMKQAGLKWFLTNKLNWNQTNRLPSSTFHWQGIDGTRVLTHVLTTPREVQHLPFPTNYKSDLSAKEVMGTWEMSTAKDTIRDLPICYGYGDGGGGPTEYLIETAKTYADMPGMPRMKLSTVRAAFEAMERGARHLPDWNTELYLEGHRGVLTSQGWIKRANRKAEAALHEAEALAAMAGTRPDLQEAWEKLCLTQFHDIVTGTSVTKVFEDARRDLDLVMAAAERAAAEAASRLARGASGPVVLNTAPLPSDRVVEVGGPFPGGQPTGTGSLVLCPALPAYSVRPLAEVARPPASPVRASCDGAAAVLESDLIRVEINAAGHLTRVFDKTAAREVLAPGAVGNELLTFEDRPVSWDAWDIDPFFEDRTVPLDAPGTLELIEDGPVRAAVRVTRRWRSSTFRQEIRLAARSKRIDFAHVTDWHETHTLLKVAFPVDILSPLATYDIQWGTIKRPTHRSTTWDMARFEVPAQKWADLSEGGYGVALLNDGKYGYDVRGNVLRLSLIKSATMPDPVADQGEHRFTYALLPHEGDWRAGVEAAAMDLNLPLRVVAPTGGLATPPLDLVRASPNVVIETLKPADDGSGVVLRAYEAERRRGPVEITLSRPLARAARCNLLEDEEAPVEVEGATLKLSLRPFEIVTMKVVPAR